MDSTTGVFLGGLVVNILTLATLMYKDRSATRREVLHREWEVQDRAVKATKAASELAAAREEIVGKLQQAHDEIVVNTKVSTEAFHEANGAKELIAGVNKSLSDEVQRRNELQLAADTARLADPHAIGTTRIIHDLRARVERLERHDHRAPKRRTRKRKALTR